MDHLDGDIMAMATLHLPLHMCSTALMALLATVDRQAVQGATEVVNALLSCSAEATRLQILVHPSTMRSPKARMQGMHALFLCVTTRLTASCPVAAMHAQYHKASV
jgi:hypothetical protein